MEFRLEARPYLFENTTFRKVFCLEIDSIKYVRNNFGIFQFNRKLNVTPNTKKSELSKEFQSLIEITRSIVLTLRLKLNGLGLIPWISALGFHILHVHAQLKQSPNLEFFKRNFPMESSTGNSAHSSIFLILKILLRFYAENPIWDVIYSNPYYY